mgnify:CR=1 FL=1
MKVGDLVQFKTPSPRGGLPLVGTVLGFPTAEHPKQFRKVRVLVGDAEEDWIMQFCEVINES